MNREEKATAVATLHERFKKATVTLLATSQGLNVTKMQQLRRAVKQAGGEYKVTKNTFTRRALQDTGFSGLHDLLEGPTGLIFGYADPVAVTKALGPLFRGEREAFDQGGGAGREGAGAGSRFRIGKAARPRGAAGYAPTSDAGPCGAVAAHHAGAGRAAGARPGSHPGTQGRRKANEARRRIWT